MRESTTEVTTMLKDMCTRISAIKANGGDCGLALYNELISVDYPFTENDLWYITDCIGRSEEVFTAIICSKIVSSKSMFYMLTIAHFNVNLCWLAFHYYDDEKLYARVMGTMEEKGLFRHKELLEMLNNSPSRGEYGDIAPVTNSQTFVHYHA